VTTDVDPESAVVIGQPPRVVAEEEAAEGEAEEGAEEAAAAEPTGEAADTAGEEG
jgi:hypothetical protein